MSLMPQLSAALVGVLSGIASSTVRWLADVMRGYARWATAHFIMIIVVGGFTGFMGSAMADAADHQEWASILSGIFGAAGAFGFESFGQRGKKPPRQTGT